MCVSLLELVFFAIPFIVRILFSVYFFNHILVVGNKKFILTQSTCMENEKRNRNKWKERESKKTHLKIRVCTECTELSLNILHEGIGNVAV